jgi:beta-lactamase class A
MRNAVTRRGLFALSIAGFAFAHGAKAGERRTALERALAGIEADSGGRLGVAVLDTADGQIAGRRLDERFSLCSTAKALICAAVLARADEGRLHLDDRIAVTAADILSYAPVAKTHVGGELTLADLCAAAITVSDNTAANLLIATLGGPAAVTAFARTRGDATTRLDRTEPDLNEAMPGDARDTTKPAAFAGLLARLAIGDALSRGSREKWVDWLIGCKTGAAKLRAGLPPDWRVGDKTGSGGHGASNDVAIVWPPSRPPLVIAAYLAETQASDAVKNGTHAAVARATAEAWGG